MNYPFNIQTLRFMHKVQYDLTYETFKNLFNTIAYHLWHRFTDTYNSNLLDFFDYLDSSNKDILMQYINSEMNHSDYL